MTEIKFLTDFKPGDKVQHKQFPPFKGEFVRYEGPFGPLPDRVAAKSPPHGMVRRVWWKGFDPFQPNKHDWTWEWAMEPALN